MKKLIPRLLLLVTCLSFTSCKKQEAPPPSAVPPKVETPPRAATIAPARKTSFEAVTSQLDPGGTVFLYLSTEQWLNGLSTKVSDFRQLAAALPDVPARDRGQIDLVFDLLARLVKTSGVEELSGVGLSGVQITPELHRTKLILDHGAGAGQGFAWSLFGRAPHPLRGLEMLPKNTGLAVFGDLDVKQVWQVLERELSQSGVPEVEKWARTWPQLFEQQTKVAWPKLLASLDGEMGLLLTLDDTRKLRLPIGREGLDIPAPGLLLAAKVNNDLLYDRIVAELQNNPQTVKTNEPGLKLCAMPLPIPLPMPVQITVASSGDYFFLATSPELVRAALEVRQGKQPGLRALPEFQALAQYVPAEGNQFLYVDRRFAETLLSLQTQILSASPMQPGQMALMNKLLNSQEPSFGFSVGAHTASGWQTVAVGNRDSSVGMVLAPAVAVPALGAGMLLPALAKAKSRAQMINSVNQLKQVGLAARMYSNDHGDKFPPAETWCEALKENLGNSAKVLKAPADSGNGACSYAYNAKLSGLDESKINPQTVAFFETAAGWNQHGGPELMLPKPRHPGVYVIGFADGSVQQISEARVSSLRWDP